MIRSFHVEGLNGKADIPPLQFHSDINLITGRNGAGKTTLLKLMWYMISGNVERIVPEINFKTAEIETDKYRLRLSSVPAEKGTPLRLKWMFTPEGGASVEHTDPVASDRIERVNTLVISHSSSSVFFPTFRRIEGGFSMEQGRSRLIADAPYAYAASNDPGDIQYALTSLSRRLTVRSHQFVASISTADIVSMLTGRYASTSEQLNEDHKKLSQDIIRLMDSTPSPADTGSDPLTLAQGKLNEIQAQVRLHLAHQENLLRPFTTLGALIGTIFRHRGIQVTSRITLGDAAEAIESGKLSAGEKQMLSFVVYNAFSSCGAIFIDEPEISLHVDWQRQLLPTLLDQGTTNQFIIATHSPFIYSRYADKELLLDSDRGDSVGKV